MNFKSKIFIQLFFVTLLFATSFSASAQAELQDSTRIKAIGLFESGDFVNATPLFEKLFSANPEDDMLNYYFGACLAEQDIFTDQTNQLLLKAVSGDTPDKIFYYVGKYFHSRGLWNSALKYYNRFSNYATEEEKQKVGIKRLIEFCYNQANPDVAKLDTVVTNNKKEVAETENHETLISDSETNIDSVQTIQSEINEPAQIPHPELKEEFIPIHFRVNTEIEYLKPGHFKNDEALLFFNMGNETEDQISNIISESDSLRELYSKSATNREAISSRILELEEELYDLKDEATVFYNKARELEQAYWVNANDTEIKSFKKDVEKLNRQVVENEQVKAEPVVDEAIEFDPGILVQELPVESIEDDQNNNDEIVFKIQVGAYSRGLPAYVDRLYKKLSLIRDIDNYTDDRGVTVYTTGNLTNFEDAVKMQAQVRQEGVKDAFVVAYKNGVRIKLSEAKKILNIK